MKSKKKWVFMKGVPSSLQAFLLALIAMVLLFILAGLLGAIPFFAENSGESAAYIVHAIIIATGCYFICRKNPKSIWYVPIIANVMAIISAIVEPNFWITSLGIFLGISIVLSILTSIFGALQGKKLQQSK